MRLFRKRGRPNEINSMEEEKYDGEKSGEW